jgi:hypothetical protein
MTTEKYIRTDAQWLKITRDSKAKTFTFARGYKNSFEAHDIEVISFKWISNWKEAFERAEIKLATYS